MTRAPMDIIVLRHATAADGDLYSDDGDRPLTAGGRAEAMIVAGALAKLGARVDLVVASPYVRAVQTAELIVPSLQYTEQVQIARRLTPESSPAAALSGVVEPAFAANLTSLMIVGHEPLLGGLLSFLLQRKGIRPGRAHCIALRYPGGAPKQTGELLWVITPSHPEPGQSLDVP